MLAGGNQKIIAIAASTGGIAALETVLSAFPATIPPVLLVQHMPQGFTRMFASRMTAKLKVVVKEAETGDILEHGQVLVAPAGKHMILVNKGAKLSVECFVGEKVQYVIPSADVLFETVASIMQSNAIGVVLTGMGADGAEGLLEMKKNGAKTIGQDKATCAVYGMPKIAFELGALDYVLPINRIADKVLSLL